MTVIMMMTTVIIIIMMMTTVIIIIMMMMTVIIVMIMMMMFVSSYFPVWVSTSPSNLLTGIWSNKYHHSLYTTPCLSFEVHKECNSNGHF